MTVLIVGLAVSAADAGEGVRLPELAWGTSKAEVRKALPYGFAACRSTDGIPFGTEACLVAARERQLSPYGTWLYFRNEVLVGWIVRTDPADRKALLAALRQRFGAPTEDSGARVTWRGAVAAAWTTFALRDGDVDSASAVTLDALAKAPGDREAARARTEFRPRPEEAPSAPRAEERSESTSRGPSGGEASSVDDGGKGESRRRQLPPRWRPQGR